MMEIEDALRLACGEGSSLTRSFWYGKFLQLLPEEETAKYTQPLAYHGAQSTPVNSSGAVAPSQPMGSEEEETTGLAHAQALSSSCSGNVDSVIQLSTEKGDEKREITGNNMELRPDFEHLRTHIVEALKCLKHCETSLSPNVYDLVVNSIDCAPSECMASISESTFLLKDCTLDWDIVSVQLNFNNEYKDYPSGARACATIAKKIYEEMMDGGKELFLSLKNSNFDWTQSPQLFTDCIEELQSDYPLKVNTSLLLGAAAFERALGDVYLGVSKATQCPPLLRDLLATAELEKTFGKSVMYMLSCVIGPPSGLNLRNILWHGFASPSEISQEYAYLFFVIVSSLGKILQPTASSESLQLSHRPFITFPQETRFANVFMELGDSDLVAIEKLFSQSFFILPSMLQTWKSALDEFKRNRHGRCVSLLLPCLEHSLRRVFACVNGCPERALTAESTTLYTTFDEILSPVLSNGQDNQLKDEIGVPKMEMLLDLLVHSEGPRVRDRISHGEVDFYRISKIISNHIVCMVVIFCLQYRIGVEKEHSEQVYKSLLSSGRKYVSLFHPLSLLKGDLEQLVSLLHNWMNIPMPEDFKLRNSDVQAKDQGFTFDAAFQTFCSKCNLHLPLVDSSFGQLERLIHTVWGMLIKTLFLSKYTMEVIGIMRQTVENALASVNQIHKIASVRFKQYEERQLRSRQRANYDHLLRSLRLYSSASAVLVILLVSVVAKLDMKSPIKYLKKVLQFAENFKSQTSSTRNRWEEADKLCYSLATLAEQLPVAPVDL